MATASVSCCVFSSAGERVCGPPLSARARGWQRGTLPPALSVPRLKERAPALKPLPWRRIQPVIAMGGRHYLVQKVSGEELNKLLDANRESSVVVGFYATWCGPCITIAQELEQFPSRPSCLE